LGRGGNLLRLSDTLIEPDPEKREAMRAAHPEPVPGRGGGKGGWMRKTPDGKMHNAYGPARRPAQEPAA
jgi:hypothetical protein